MKLRLLLLISTVSIFSAGCDSGGGGGGGAANPGDETPLGPEGRVFFGNAQLSGSTSSAPVSANFALGIHGVGGNFLKTTSSSSSFKMISGVGVD